MAFIGSCTDMCPENERQMRFGLMMSIFECDENNQPNESAMIKEYRRSGANQDEPAPEDLRTPRALELTMNYLCSNIMDDPRSTTQENALNWYDFLWDRLRAIRKDITQQNICDQSSIILVERCARFHVHSCYAMNHVKGFDTNMNKRNLNDCLQMLRQMYTDLRLTGQICPGELEFQKYDILLHLNEDHSSSNVLMKTSDHRATDDMKFITKVYNAVSSNDFHNFFKLMEKADYMTSCILSLYASKMRLTGLKIITAACTPRQSAIYPVESIIDLLGFDDLEDLKSFASTLDIEVMDKSLILTKEVIRKKAEPSVFAFKSRRLVENKMHGQLVGHLVYKAPFAFDSLPQVKIPTNSDSIEMCWQESSGIDLEPPNIREVQQEYYKDEDESEEEQEGEGEGEEEEEEEEEESEEERGAQPQEQHEEDEEEDDDEEEEEDEETQADREEEQEKQKEKDKQKEKEEKRKEKEERDRKEKEERERREKEDKAKIVAKIMPAGRFKRCSLASKCPTLQLVPDCQTLKSPSRSPTHAQIPPKRLKSLDYLREGIADELEVNNLFVLLARIIDQ